MNIFFRDGVEIFEILYTRKKTSPSTSMIYWSYDTSTHLCIILHTTILHKLEVAFISLFVYDMWVLVWKIFEFEFLFCRFCGLIWSWILVKRRDVYSLKCLVKIGWKYLFACPKSRILQFPTQKNIGVIFWHFFVGGFQRCVEWSPL